MNDLKSFLEQFEKLQQKKLKVQAEREVLLQEKNALLQELPADIDPYHLETFLTDLEKQLRAEIQQLTIPQEYLNELKSLD